MILLSIQSKYRILLSLPQYKKAKIKTIEFDKKLKDVSSLFYKLSKKAGNKKHALIINISRCCNYSFMFVAYLIVKTKSKK